MPARREIRVEDSWRVVDGENDSFETTVLPSLPSDSSSILQPLSDSSQSFNQTQQSTDSIGDFARHHAEQDVIKREPFRPSVASLKSPFRTPDPEFRMPRLDSQGASRRSSGRSSRTVVPAHHPAAISTGSPVKRGRRKPKFTPEPSSAATVQSIASWALSVVALAFSYARRPLALLLAVYLSCGALIVTQNMLQRSVSASLSPLCRIPGASFLRLPFCPEAPPGPVEFDQLVNVQSKFEDVLAHASDGVSLPFEMKRSETALRDLRTLLRHSEVQSRDELVFEVDGYIEASRQTAADLQRFNAHVGSAVDSVISINRWTSRYLDTLEPIASSSSSTDLSIWSSWVFAPFQPSDRFSEAALRTQYVEHTALVSERIATLILEAQAVLRLLTKAEDHLSLIHEVSSRSEKIVTSRRDQVFWTIWTLVGANSAKLHGLAEQLSLLRKIDGQRSAAVQQLSALVVELEAIQAGLGDLRDRVAEPALLRDKVLPLSVHIETIDRGVERLDAARKRIRAAEDDRVKEALSRNGVKDERLLEAHGEL